MRDTSSIWNITARMSSERISYDQKLGKGLQAIQRVHWQIGWY